jgi:hypothetical protein
MKLFRRGNGPAPPADASPTPAEPVPAVPRVPNPKPLEISLSEEQKCLLEKPIDPRVDRILQEIYADKEAAERALKSRRIIEFPHGDSGERHVIQDEDGFWRIVPGAPPVSLNEFFDAI